MTSKKKKAGTNGKRDDSLDSVEKMLRELAEIGHGHPPPAEELPKDVRKACEEAARAAWIVGNLRKAHAQIGFAPHPFHEYLEGLAKVAKVTLEPLRARLGVKTLSRPTIANASLFADLAKEIGLSLRHALVQIRMAFLDSAGQPCGIALQSARSLTGTAPCVLERCEAALEESRAQCPPGLKDELDQIEKKVHLAFEGTAEEDVAQEEETRNGPKRVN